jgi:hypothetical protein
MKAITLISTDPSSLAAYRVAAAPGGGWTVGTNRATDGAYQSFHIAPDQMEPLVEGLLRNGFRQLAA